MKVLHVIDSLPTGGGARFVVNSVPRFNEMGITTDVLLLDGTKTAFYNELEQCGSCKVINLTIGRRWDVRNIYRIIPYLTMYDIIHVHIFPASYFVALAHFFARKSNPVIFTEHNSQNRRATNFLMRYAEKFVYSQFNKVICLTSDVKKFVVKNLSVTESKLKVIENGIDIGRVLRAKAYKKSDFGFTDSEKLILMSARFEVQKDHDTIIKSLQLLPQNICLILAGDGSRLPFFKKMVKSLKLEDRVIFLGNRKDIFEIMKMCDFIVLSSNFEGLSLSAIEGLASGKPFIASNVPGLDFIKNHGILFQKGNFTALSRIIQELSEDSNYYNETVKRCLRLASQYDIKYMIEKYITTYNNVIKTP